MEHTKNYFIQGPIPYQWLLQANSLGGSTGAIASSLWFYVGLNYGSKKFKTDRHLGILSGISRQTRHACLKRLHHAGLIILTTRVGAYPIVEIIASDHKPKLSNPFKSSKNYELPLELETKIHGTLDQATLIPNFRKSYFQKQGYSHEK